MAVKVIRPNAKYIEEAKQEADFMRQVRSPFLPPCLDARPWRNRFLLVTPAYGANLYAVLKARNYKPIKSRLALRYVE